MNSKTLLILKQLMGGKSLKQRELAEQLDISPRLVRYEMNEVNTFLEREGIPPLDYDRVSGYKMTLSEQQKAGLKRKLTNLDTYDYAMNSAERRCVMALMLLANGDKTLTSQFFADQLGVSKSSIDKDMALLKNELSDSGISLDSKASKGSTLEGDEQEIRRYGVSLLEKHLDFADICQGEDESLDMVGRWGRRLFCDQDLPELFKAVQALEEEILGKWLVYDSLRMVTLELAVMLARVRAGKSVQAEPANISLVKTAKEYVHAVLLATDLEQRFSISLPAGEVYALAILLAGAKYVTPEPYLKEDWVEVQILLDRLVRGMSVEMELDFTKDKELYDALQAHLGPTVFRLKHGISLANPQLLEIKKSYRGCFEALRKVLADLDSELLGGITEDDIAYLVLHFCAAIERKKRMISASRVAIVCVHGAGTANLLRELVSSKFKNIRVVATLTYTDVQILEKMKVDFVIASISLPGCKVPWVQVETIPTAENWEMIRRMSMEYGTGESIGNDRIEFFEDVLLKAQRYCEEKEKENLRTDLEDCFDSYGMARQIDCEQPALCQLLTQKKVMCRERASDWEDAVRQACDLLLKAEDVTPEFVLSAIQSVKDAGPYVVIMPGVALIHGKVGKGVKHLAMSLITFENDVYFHHPTNDPVRLVFCMAATDNRSHLQALRDLRDLLDMVPVQTLCEVKTPQELYNYLKGSSE